MSATSDPCFVSLLLANLAIAIFNIAWSTYYRGRDATALLAHSAIISVLVFIPTVLVGVAWQEQLKTNEPPLFWLVLVLGFLAFFHVCTCVTAYRRIKYHPADVSD